ncbi:hypothetical protein JCM10207_005050 [Rhodosporidiobolus poonsookiae]
MARRPRCPVCRSKRWHRDALSGSIVCEEGHLLQGYVQETTETQEGPSQHTQQTRRMRKNRQRKLRPPNNDYFHGDRARFLVYQAMQLILREQVRVVIDHLGFPAELEAVTRDLWALLVASSNVAPAPRNYDRGEEPAGSYSGPRPGDRFWRIGRRKKRVKREKGDEGDEEENDDDAGGAGANGAGAPPETTDTEREGGSDDDESDADSRFSDEGGAEDADDERPRLQSRANSAEPPGSPDPSGAPAAAGADGARATANLYNPPKRTPRYVGAKPASADPREHPRMDFTLLILYLACVTLRLPVFLSDIFHLAESYQILYLDAVLHLPAAMQTHLSGSNRRLLSPTSTPHLAPIASSSHPSQADSAQATLARLVAMFHDDWGVEFPEANVPLLVGKVGGLCGLPPVAQLLTQRLLALLPLSTSFALPTSLSTDLRGLSYLPPSLASSSTSSANPAGEKDDARAPAWPVRPVNGMQDWRTALPEVKIASAVVCVCRMLWALDTDDEAEGANPILKDYANLLPPCSDWLAAVEALAALDRPGDPASLWSGDVADMNADEVDAYLDFFETRIVSKEKVPSRLADLSRFFPAEDAISSAHDLPTPATYLSRVDGLLSYLLSSPSTTPSTTTASSASLPSYVLPPPSTSSSHHAPHFSRLTSPSALPTPLHRLLTSLASRLVPPPQSLPTGFSGAAPSAEDGAGYLLGMVTQLEGAVARVPAPLSGGEGDEESELGKGGSLKAQQRAAQAAREERYKAEKARRRRVEEERVEAGRVRRAEREARRVVKVKMGKGKARSEESKEQEQDGEDSADGEDDDGASTLSGASGSVAGSAAGGGGRKRPRAAPRRTGLRVRGPVEYKSKEMISDSDMELEE